MYKLFSLNVGLTAASGVVSRPRISNSSSSSLFPSSSSSSSSSSPSSDDDSAFQTLVSRGRAAVELRTASTTSTPATTFSRCSSSSGEGRGSGGGGGTGTYSLGLQEVLRLPTPISSVRCPVYEPTSSCVFFVANNHALVQLDSSGTVGLVAGNLYTQRAAGADGAAAGDGELAGIANSRTLTGDVIAK
ncbi:Ankyrin repeat and BTB/POZ domain-containing protein 1 [Pleodorina starrii]|uniref:Ankyrin repeat and BTB/POZ domain-containing protein 1 n=1 Tax=Pleodorina starrii TaxID=330485 RepID=A0A9W6BHC0_9CHLO|nr:Ankyrin repeat and BTB/POZ domain-containing protein 1 [Pleodorina starrii]GLC69528.1 Ankyrin repeat and BTB/POZ domain-containing protein 1 [Pleodorina starrii]